jgi:hypothetical protein
MVSIEFIPNQDGITTTMVADSRVIDNEIPFVPRKLVDSRGIALWQFCHWKRLNFETDLKFINETWDERDDLKKLYDYMQNPVYVRQTIQDLQQQKAQVRHSVIKRTANRS